MGSTTTVCVFLQTGRTFTFRDAVIVQDNEAVITIEYVAMSDGNKKRAIFQKAIIAGWSVALNTAVTL